ncbi:MAG: hypothetical protein HY553_11660 [Elusimicrobia bacterium]|nr:hypothetical protein [Elusimicrobiota bacterium]
MPRSPRFWGWLSLAVWALHGVVSSWRGEPFNMLWACNVSCLLIGVGLLARVPLAHAVGLLWNVTGMPFWLVDLATGGEFILTSCLTHLGGFLAGALVLPERPMAPGSWRKAFLLWIAFQLFCRWATPPAANVNLVFTVWPGWEGVFPTFARYHAFLLTFALISFAGGERAAIAYGSRRPTVAQPA